MPMLEDVQDTIGCLDRPPGPSDVAGAAPAPESVDEHAPEAAIVCRSCGNEVTNDRRRIQVHGAHQHRFMNPAGHLFRIGCFAEAPGCVVIGPPSAEYPWFAGHTWRHAHCGQCGEHLGWYFQDDAGSFFFGLRLDRIVDARPT